MIRKLEYTQPTAIQSQAIPAALSGRDLIGIAKTGSGKTAAFVWPMLVHILDQAELQPGDGPIALILAPTRELSLQIYNEAKKFGKVYNFNVVCCYGGGSKWEQSKALEQGAEIIVATPGRMIDMVKMKATNLQRVTYLVLDEADKMLNMGFGAYIFVYISIIFDYFLQCHCFSFMKLYLQSLKCGRFAIMCVQTVKLCCLVQHLKSALKSWHVRF